MPMTVHARQQDDADRAPEPADRHAQRDDHERDREPVSPAVCPLGNAPLRGSAICAKS